MNIFKRIYNSSLLKKLFHDNGLADEKTSARPLWFSDGFKVKNVKLNALTEDIKQKALMIFNETTNEQYNYIEKKRYDIIIKKKNFYTEDAGIYATDLETYTKKAEINFNQVNMCLIAGTAGKGKTTIAKKIIKQFKKDIIIYTPKADDYKEYSTVKTFEETEILELTQKLKKFNEDRDYRQELNELIVIDEFYLMCNLTTSKQLILELNKTLAFNRASNLKIIAISQTINRSMLGNFNIALANMMLINVPDIENYESSIGKLPKKYKAQIPNYKFLKITLDEPMEVLFIND